MTIDLEQLDKLVVDADQIFLTADGEKVLLKLLEIQKQVEDAIESAEKKLEEAGLKIDPNFSSIQSNKIKVYYRFFGSRYKVDQALADQLPKNLYKVMTKYNAIPEEIEKYAEENKGLPLGILEIERKKQLHFADKNKKEEND